MNVPAAIALSVLSGLITMQESQPTESVTTPEDVEKEFKALATPTWEQLRAQSETEATIKRLREEEAQKEFESSPEGKAIRQTQDMIRELKSEQMLIPLLPPPLVSTQ